MEVILSTNFSEGISVASLLPPVPESWTFYTLASDGSPRAISIEVQLDRATWICKPVLQVLLRRLYSNRITSKVFSLFRMRQS